MSANRASGRRVTPRSTGACTGLCTGLSAGRTCTRRFEPDEGDPGLPIPRQALGPPRFPAGLDLLMASMPWCNAERSLCGA